MKLPNGKDAQLGDKLERYCLNDQHPKGKHKAALFRNRLGITLETKAVLEKALLEVAASADVIVYRKDFYGIQYDIQFLMQTEVGTSQVLSCWIVRTQENFPRLTNAYPVG